MRTLCLINLWKISLILVATSFAGGGCGKKGPPADTVFKTAGKAAVVSAETNSFQEVSSYLDPGGSFYLYLGTEQWLKGLSTKLNDWREVLTTLPNMSSGDRANVGKLVDVVSELVKTSGVEDISGVGASGIMVEPGMYQNKFVIHHYPGRAQGLLWSAFGKAPHSLGGLDYLPAGTALASFLDVDVPQVWGAIREQLQGAGIPEITKALEQFPVELEKRTGLKLESILASLGGELGVVLTLDEERSVKLPGPGGATLEIPEPALALVVKVKDETLFDRFDQLMSQNPKVVKVDKSGLKMRSLPLPMPFPVKPTVARVGEYLVLASSDKLVEEMVAVHGGSSRGLKGTDEFAKLSKGMVLQGNRFDYVSARLGRTLQHIVSTAVFMQSQSGGQAGGGAELFQRLLGEGQEMFSFSVASNLKEGWFVSGKSSQHPAASLVGPTAVAPVAIAAGFALPALARAKERAQSITCVNNLKQIGLAARMYANDHNRVLPRDFVAMKNQLNSPKVLICPRDNAKTRATDWSGFSAANSSYEIVSPGAGEAEVQKVFARCLLHGHVCLVDGSVQQSGGSGRPVRRRN